MVLPQTRFTGQLLYRLPRFRVQPDTPFETLTCTSVPAGKLVGNVFVPREAAMLPGPPGTATQLIVAEPEPKLETFTFTAKVLALQSSIATAVAAAGVFAHVSDRVKGFTLAAIVLPIT